MKNRIGLDIALVLLAVAVGVGLSLKPWEIYREQRKLTEKSVKAMEKAESEQTDLAKRRVQLESPVGREEYLREQGYHRDDETPLTK